MHAKRLYGVTGRCGAARRTQRNGRLIFYYFLFIISFIMHLSFMFYKLVLYFTFAYQFYVFYFYYVENSYKYNWNRKVIKKSFSRVKTLYYEVIYLVLSYVHYSLSDVTLLLVNPPTYRTRCDNGNLTSRKLSNYQIKTWFISISKKMAQIK